MAVKLLGWTESRISHPCSCSAMLDFNLYLRLVAGQIEDSGSEGTDAGLRKDVMMSPVFRDRIRVSTRHSCSCSNPKVPFNELSASNS